MANRLAQQGALVEGFYVLVFTVEIVLLVVCRSKLLFWVAEDVDRPRIDRPWYAELAVLQSGAIDDCRRCSRRSRSSASSDCYGSSRSAASPSSSRHGGDQAIRQALVLTSFVFLVATTLLATLLYLCESPANPGVVTAVDFESVPAAAWFVLITLTTVGYGDVVPVTTAGKLIALCAVVFGIIVIAMPLAVVGTNFIVVYNIYVKATMAGGEGKDGKVGLLEKVSMIRRGSIAGSPVSFRRGSGVAAACREPRAGHAPRSSASHRRVCVSAYDRIHHTSRAENEYSVRCRNVSPGGTTVGQFGDGSRPKVSSPGTRPHTSRTLRRPPTIEPSKKLEV